MKKKPIKNLNRGERMNKVHELCSSFLFSVQRSKFLIGFFGGGRLKKREAFTLLEVLLSITFITVVFTAVTGLILTTLFVNGKNVRTLQATYLAQEGLEAMRAIRDSNWLQNYKWDEGESQWGANFGLTLGETENEFYLVEASESEAYWSLTPVSLTNEDAGLVTLEGGQEFVRLIRVEPVPDEVDPNVDRTDALKITAVVTWENRGRPGEVAVSTILTDWQ